MDIHIQIFILAAFAFLRHIFHPSMALNTVHTQGTRMEWFHYSNKLIFAHICVFKRIRFMSCSLYISLH